MLLLLLQSVLDRQAQAAAKGQPDHHADLLRMTRESMNGSFTAKLNSLGKPMHLPHRRMLLQAGVIADISMQSWRLRLA